MKKSELQQLIREEIQRELRERAKSNDTKLKVTVDRSNRYFSDGMLELSSWYAKEFSEHLFGSKHNIKPVDFIGNDTFILAFTGSGLKDLKSKINSYVDSLNRSWNSDGLTIKTTSPNN